MAAIALVGRHDVRNSKPGQTETTLAEGGLRRSGRTTNPFEEGDGTFVGLMTEPDREHHFG